MKVVYRLFVLVSILCACTFVQGQRRDIAQEERLKKLMTKVGVDVADVSAKSNQLQGYREVKIRWTDSPGKPSISVTEQKAAPDVSLVEDKKRSGTLPRHRSLELSPTHVFIAAINEANQLRWWTTISDPRVVRAEFQTSTGELRSQNYYQSNFTLNVAFPDDPKITNLRFYKPIWTGSDYDLKLLAVVPVR